MLQNLLQFVPNLVGMLRAKSPHITKCKELLFEHLQSISEERENLRIELQENELIRIKQVRFKLLLSVLSVFYCCHYFFTI